VSDLEHLERLRHDLRTPLTIIAGFAELLAGERPLTADERRDYARRIVAAAHEMRALLEADDAPR